MNESKAIYNAISIVSEENRVRGFDPTRLTRKTKDGPKLDLKIKKLWFRLKYPNGRIKLSPLTITDQLAVIEARVYLDKGDAQPAFTFTAQTEKDSTPGGLFVELAQHTAADEALSAAGFDIKVNGVHKATPVSYIDTPPKQTVERPIAKPVAEVPKQKAEPMPITVQEAPPVVADAVTEAVHEIVPDTVAETVAEPMITEPVVNDAPIVSEQVAEPTTSVVEEAIATSVEDAIVATVVTPVAETETVDDEVTEIREDEVALPYTKDMSVEEICALMSIDEAKGIIVPSGVCKGWTLQQVAERRRPSIEWYVQSYPGDDNILRAGATIMKRLLDSQAA